MEEEVEAEKEREKKREEGREMLEGENYCKRRENEIHRASYRGRYFSPL